MREFVGAALVVWLLIWASAAFGQTPCFPLEVHTKALKEIHGEELAWSATIENDDGSPRILRMYVNPITGAWTLTMQPRASVLVSCVVQAGFDFRAYTNFGGRGA